MKTQISRISFAASKRYSGVYQQMGRMLTDSDWNELAEIIKRRLADTTNDNIGSGTPRNGGLVKRTESGGSVAFELQWGRAYVDGIGADIRPDPTATLDSAHPERFDYEKQADFPQAPALPTAGDFRLYLDVWERTVIVLEDDELRDPGLHGADTCTRTQTMAQVKWCPTSLDPEDPATNPPIGTAVLTLELRQGSTEPDTCDPCADEIPLHDSVDDYLFRVEVHDVEYNSDGAPTRVTLKWSSENGAEQYDHADLPPGFDNEHWAYEFFSGTDQGFASEKQLGRHLATGFSPVRHDLVSGYPSTPPAGFPLVRRWDGYCVLTKSGTDWTLTEGFDRGATLSTSLAATAHGHVDEGTSVTVQLQSIVLTAALGDEAQLAGDFWTAVVRRAVNSAGDVLMAAAAPEGIRHHYMKLGDMDYITPGDITSRVFMPAWGDACRRFEFPPLTDLRADDLCYEVPTCDTNGNPTVRSLLESALGDAFPNPGDAHGTVRQILDALLCDQTAATIPIAKGPNLCPDLKDAATIQDALDALCQRGIEGCATFTVFPRSGWETVFQQIPEGADAHVCFREGEYRVPDTVVIAKKGNLLITGAGPGTRIVCKSREAALRFEGCQSVKVADLYAEGRALGSIGNLEHFDGALTFVNCSSVNVADATLRCAPGTRPAATCLTVRHTGSNNGSASVTGCRFEIGHRQTGMLLMDLEHTTVRDNTLTTRPKPRSFTLERQLADPKMAARARRLLISGAVVRAFDKISTSGKKVIQMDTQGNRRILFDSPVAASGWKEAITTQIGQRTLKSNQELLNEARAVAHRALTQPAFRTKYSLFGKWLEALRMQDPAVASKGIVCAGRIARDVHILNNTLDGVQEGIHVGLSDHVDPGRRMYIAGRVLIEGNTIQVRLPPLAIHRRGGIFVGNCNNLSILNNQIQVQRYLWSRNIPLEGIRVYGHLGRMMIIRQNYMTHCTTGVFVKPLPAIPQRLRPVAKTQEYMYMYVRTFAVSQKRHNQWLVADNMMPDAHSIVIAPRSVAITNNLN